MPDEEREVTSLTGGVIDGFTSYLERGAEWEPKPPATVDEIMATLGKIREAYAKRPPPQPIAVTRDEYAALRREALRGEHRRGHVIIVPERHGAGALGTPLVIVDSREESTIWQEVQRQARAQRAAQDRAEARLREYYGIPFIRPEGQA
ncbi:hypothetical protein UFOVP1360_39 [uncultured Caudovirales phage]|uniref:Uncharacterized protein n=1 Tax=uncultured Caudovirales phage TaxID=2100421 RepID=A0A6J5S1D0_9CAUD|nr:hypothetical protein UFOVP1360_39 [uncultured Caudovirales phage]